LHPTTNPNASGAPQRFAEGEHQSVAVRTTPRTVNWGTAASKRISIQATA